MRTVAQLQETYGGDAPTAVARAIRMEVADGAWILDTLAYARDLRERCSAAGRATDDVDLILVGLLGLTGGIIDSVVDRSNL